MNKCDFKIAVGVVVVVVEIYAPKKRKQNVFN
jgi:hypothetical protein